MVTFLLRGVFLLSYQTIKKSYMVTYKDASQVVRKKNCQTPITDINLLC